MFSFLTNKCNGEFLIETLSNAAKLCLWTRSSVKRTAFFCKACQVKPLQLTTFSPEKSAHGCSPRFLRWVQRVYNGKSFDAGWWSLFKWSLIADCLPPAFERVHCLKFIRIRNKVPVVIAMVLITSHKDY